MLPLCRGKYGRYWARSEPGANQPAATEADFVGDLQGVVGESDDEPRPLSTTPFHSVDGQILHSLRALLPPERQAEGHPERGAPAGDPDAVAALLRAVADLLDGGR